MSPELVIILVGSLVAGSCALVGSFLVLRRMALLGDAISHAVLPGIVLAFLATGERSTLPMVIGAAAFGVITVVLVELLQKTERLKEDASIGVVFPVLFSIGVLLLARYANQVDLDLDCVLYGEIAYAPWDVLVLGGRTLGPKALWINGGVFLVNLLLVVLLYKELKLSTFDRELAATLGFAPAALHYGLMAATSWTVVGAFESVGAILVVAMLVVPPAAAYLLTERLSRMLALSVGFGVASAALGYLLARAWDASIAGAMGVVAGLIFLASFLLSPRHGLLAGTLRHARLARATREQLVLLHLADHGLGVSLPDLAQRFGWSPRRLGRAVEALAERGFADLTADRLTLTREGSRALEESGQGPLRHRVG
ncbi:MAG TPA: iron chelate uptake ABC transporter family permease subunit [Thermoanaerobaculia bacterium]|nr:iron chelate uptake ABC transporter family permease subunit [Thermoanaerobaculia bacterium]